MAKITPVRLDAMLAPFTSYFLTTTYTSKDHVDIEDGDTDYKISVCHLYQHCLDVHE